MASERADVYTRITNEIVAAIEAGAGKWKMPWHHDGEGGLKAPTARSVDGMPPEVV